jgi:hypothetical protein
MDILPWLDIPPYFRLLLVDRAALAQPTWKIFMRMVGVESGLKLIYQEFLRLYRVDLVVFNPVRIYGTVAWVLALSGPVILPSRPWEI